MDRSFLLRVFMGAIMPWPTGTIQPRSWRRWAMKRDRERLARCVQEAGATSESHAGCSKRPPNEAAGGAATEAYVFRYVAGRRTTENKVGGLFQHPATWRSA